MFVSYLSEARTEGGQHQVGEGERKETSVTAGGKVQRCSCAAAAAT